MKHFSKSDDIHKPPAGFTLVELLVAALISAVVISIAGFGVITIMTINQRAEARTKRRIDLSRAFDFMSNEIRMARSINRTATTVANGTTITLENVVTSSGLNLSDLGSYGTIVLYLEIPLSPKDCSGNPGPTFDRVVYDLRANTNGWLGPRVISRYGRIPKSDGTINPCSNPVGSDTLVDSIAAANIIPTPTCNSPATLSGIGGFYACVNGGRVDLSLHSRLSDSQAHKLTSRAVSRLSSSTTAAPVLSGTRTGTNVMNLSWQWTGGSATFNLWQRVGSGSHTEVYTGADLSVSSTLAGNPGDANCYKVTATVGLSTSAYSNEVCELK